MVEIKPKICYNKNMDWFNFYGLCFMLIIMVPNIIYFIKNKNETVNNAINKLTQVFEQIGRYACFIFMIFNLPYTYFNFWFNYALVVYLTVNSLLCFIYLLFWLICFKKNSLLKALTLSIIPTVIFLFSGLVLLNIPLIIFSILFGVTHIYISCKNALKTELKTIN